MLDQILLDKVAYDTDIPEWRLRNSPAFWDYWQDYLMSADDNWRLTDVIDFTLELGYTGQLGDGVWDEV
jgi:hypothetical protein